MDDATLGLLAVLAVVAVAYFLIMLLPIHLQMQDVLHSMRRARAGRLMETPCHGGLGSEPTWS